MRKIDERTYAYLGRTIYKGLRFVECYFSTNPDGSMIISWTQEDMKKTIRTGKPATGRCWTNYRPSDVSGWREMIPTTKEVC